jgi:hypothetical protein
MRSVYAVIGASLLLSSAATAQVSGVSPGNLPGSISSSAPGGADDAFQHDAVQSPDVHEPLFLKDHAPDYTPPRNPGAPKSSVTVTPVNPPPLDEPKIPSLAPLATPPPQH